MEKARHQSAVQGRTGGSQIPLAAGPVGKTQCRLERRSRGAGLWHCALDDLAGGRSDREANRAEVSSGTRLADFAFPGLELPATGGAGHPTRRTGHPAVETGALAGNKKKALQQRRTIVFVDESGLSERPHRVRTWSPRGQTPVLQYSFNWKRLSAMAGITIWNFYFRLFPGSIKAPQVIQFLGHLQ